MQRPQHVMKQLAATFDIVFWEEPVLSATGRAELVDRALDGGAIRVVTPHLPPALHDADRTVLLEQLLRSISPSGEEVAVKWYYTPMMLPFSRSVNAMCTVYDCMDELSNFKFAPPELKSLEIELFSVADVVFTGGYSLFEAKRRLHENIHPFPSSVDRAHFAAARRGLEEPGDQGCLPRPRLGYFGVIDERLDLDLVARLADAHPDWSVVLVGPVVKIDPSSLPRRSNIFYLGIKPYADLPAYLSGWDVALMPFAINDSTRFISPTKTPEYLAGGRPVVSTAIRDVERHYGDLAGVSIARSPSEFVTSCEQAMQLGRDWLDEADQALAGLSWENACAGMLRLVRKAMERGPATTGRHRSLAPTVARARRPTYDYLIVGAGFAGSVLAERLAAGLGKRVLIIDKRPHVAGNAYDRRDEAGVLIHEYGPHIFHTNSADIFAYLSRFTRWRPYEHKVLANVGEQLVPMPINRATLNLLYGLRLATDEEAAAYLASVAEAGRPVCTAEDAVVSQVGRELYETFFRGYTRKQWGLDPSMLDKSVTARVPARVNDDDRYFTDQYQYMPLAGYTAMFEKMLDHENIDIALGTEFKDVSGELAYDRLIYTGRIDEYFSYRYGQLPYRSLQFRRETLDRPWFQPVGTVNFPAEWIPFTRITEFKHLTGQEHASTSIAYEYPTDHGAPYYPVPRAENQELYKRYEALARKLRDVHFVGRLATYRYYNMDQVVGQALATFRRIAGGVAPHLELVKRSEVSNVTA